MSTRIVQIHQEVIHVNVKQGIQGMVLLVVIIFFFHT